MTIVDEIDTRQVSEHWIARCVENGVPLDDYLTTTAGIDRWQQWCDAWVATADRRAADATVALERGETLTSAELRLAAALEYHFAKFLFVHDMAAVRRVTSLSAESYRRAMADLPWPGERLDVAFDDALFPGIIRRPYGEGPHAAVVVVPGLDATKEEMHRLQEVFLRRGMATFSFDGPGQGESEFDHPLRPDWERVAAAALDVLERQPGIDADRLALVGVSLGGYYAARAACAEPRLRAAASIGGCYSFGDCWAALPPLARQAFQVRSGAHDALDADAHAREFDVRALAATAGVPFLVLHGGRDRLFDTRQAERMASHFGAAATLIVEPDGNHVLHNLALRVRPRVADWIAGHVGASNGRRRRGLWHRSHGDASEATVLLLHSLALDAGIWDGVVEDLARHVTVVTCDLPGHGRSPSPAPTSIDAIADEVATLVRTATDSPVIAGGLSLGGCVAQALAVRHPELVRGLALADTTAWYGPTARQDWRGRAERARRDGLASLADFQLARWFSPGFREARPEVASRLLATFAHNGLDDYERTCHAMGAMDQRATVGRIGVPTAVMVGELDRATPVSAAADLARRIPDATLTVVEGCSHLSPLEAPQRFIEEIRSLVERCARKDRA